jgi:hypothetical protein
MFWDKKTDEKRHLLPELPPLNVNIHRPEIQSVNSFPAPPEEEDSMAGNKLPAFPESAAHDKFSQVAIKEAIRDERGPEFPSEREKSFRQSLEEAETEEWAPTTRPPEQERPIHEMKVPYKKLEEAPKLMKEEKKEIFVKIDKFRSAKKSLNLIAKNIEEMEALIKKIRETKMREDQEFANWENTVDSLKARIENVREDIFERI